MQTRDDFIRYVILRRAGSAYASEWGVEATLQLANSYADKLFPVNAEEKHLTICRLLRNCNLQKLATLPTEECYTYLSEVLDSKISQEDIKLFSHLAPNNEKENNQRN
jgi:hypothetical protein